MSNRVSLLRQALQSFLLSVCPRVSYGRADPVAPFPRLVFDLPNSYDDGETEVFLLQVDGWDDSNDTAALEALMAAVDGDGAHQNASGLHRVVISAGGMRAGVYRDKRFSLRDDDPRLQHRQYAYQVRVYEG